MLGSSPDAYRPGPLVAHAGKAGLLSSCPLAVDALSGALFFLLLEWDCHWNIWVFSTLEGLLEDSLSLLERSLPSSFGFCHSPVAQEVEQVIY